MDDQLILEMQNKESLEQHLAFLETEQLNSDSAGSTPSSSPQHTGGNSATSNTASRHKEIKTLHQKLDKSGEKVDALRLLMLQYCSGLQNCINSLETEESEDRGASVDGNTTASSLGNSPPPSSTTQSTLATAASTGEDTDSPKIDRKRTTFGGMSQGVGGFVRRASSSVKEKMSSFKDFGRKSTGKAMTLGRVTDQAEPTEDVFRSGTLSERNNSGLNPGLESGEQAQASSLQRNARSKSDGQVENLVRLAETSSAKSSSTLEINNVVTSPDLKDGARKDNASQSGSFGAQLFQHPEVKIHVESADSSDVNTEKRRREKKRLRSDEPKHLLREAIEDGLQILRSKSDSDLELKMGESIPGARAGRIPGHRRSSHVRAVQTKASNQLSPRNILTYHGGSALSLPQLSSHEDSDSDSSDFVVLDTSDEEARHSDSTSEYDYDDDDGVLTAVTDVTFEGDPRVASAGPMVGTDEDGSPEHRAVLQHLHTYQV